MSEIDSNNKDHFHFLPSSRYRSKRRKPLNFQFRQAEHARFLSYAIPEKMKEVRDAQQAKYLLRNEIAKQIVQMGLPAQELRKEHIEALAEQMGKRNLQVDQLLLEDIKQRVIRMSSALRYRQTPKRGF